MEPLFSARDQIVLVKYLYYMKNNASAIHKLLIAACGEGAADYKIVKDWIQDFSDGREEPDDQNKPDEIDNVNVTIQPQAPTCPAMVTRIEALVAADRRISLDRVAGMAMVTKHTAQQIVSGVLGLKRVCERWVPRLWTPEQRQYRTSICQELLDRYEREGDDFLSRIVCGDEGFVHYYIPDTAPVLPPVQRKPSKSVPIDRYKPQVEPAKVYFIMFYDQLGMLLLLPIEENITITPEFYSDIIKNELAPAYKRRRQRDPKNMLLLHDNNPIHNSTITQTTLKDLGIESLPNAPASPDLEPQEYFLFNFLKSRLRDIPYPNAYSINSAISHLLYNLTDVNYTNSIKKLVSRWDHCIDSKGLYFL